MNRHIIIISSFLKSVSFFFNICVSTIITTGRFMKTLIIHVLCNIVFRKRCLRFVIHGCEYIYISLIIHVLCNIFFS